MQLRSRRGTALGPALGRYARPPGSPSPQKARKGDGPGWRVPAFRVPQLDGGLPRWDEAARGGAAEGALRRAALRVDEYVILLNAGGMVEVMVEIVTLLQERAIDTGVVSLSTTSQAKRLGYVELVNLADLDIAYPFTGLVVRRSWAEANRDLL